MQIYANLGNNSSVVAYEIGDDFIKVQFKKNKHGVSYVYTYNHIAPGKVQVDIMKAFAKGGQGLGSHIVRIVKDNYYDKQIAA